MLQVEGREPCEEIALAANAPTAMKVKADVTSIVPIETLEVLVNGEIVETIRASKWGRA